VSVEATLRLSPKSRFRRISSTLVGGVPHGPGTRGEDQQMLFERSRQGGDVMTDKPAGTGLGLPISRQIVEHFGGKLWVESTPGRGACFRFSVPKQSGA